MKKFKKSNLILLFIFLLVVLFGIFAYSRYRVSQTKKAMAIAEQNKLPVELTCYSYGGVEKVGYLNYKVAVDSLIAAYNSSNGEALAAMIDFAAEDVLRLKGLEHFDENIYKLITDAENYKEPYYNESFLIMCTFFQNNEANFIEAANKHKVKMELKELSDLTKVEESKYLYEATAKIKIKDKTLKKTYNSNSKITFISYNEGKSYYIVKVEEVAETKK